jgi:uncharacterized protein (TIGR04222 family)
VSFPDPWTLISPASPIPCAVAALLGALLLAAGTWVSRGTGPADRTRVSAEELGYLRRGRRGVVEASVARLIFRGGLRPTRHGILTVTDPAPDDDLDRAVRAAARGGRTLPEALLHARGSRAVQAVESRAVARGWAVDPGAVRRRRVAAALLPVLVAVAGLVRIGAGGADPATTGPAVTVLVAAVVLAVWWVARSPRQTTRAGRRVLRDARAALADGAVDVGLHPDVRGAVGMVAVSGLRAHPDPDILAALTATPDIPMSAPAARTG